MKGDDVDMMLYCRIAGRENFPLLIIISILLYGQTILEGKDFLSLNNILPAIFQINN